MIVLNVYLYYNKYSTTSSKKKISLEGDNISRKKTTQKIKKEKPIIYHHEQKTDEGAKKIVTKLMQYPITVVNVGTGGGKTFMAIRALAVYQPDAYVLVITTKKQVDSKDWDKSFDSYNKVTNSHIQYNVFNYENIHEKDSKKHPIKVELNTLKMEVLEALAAHQDQPLYIIADEAHKLKNPSSKNFKYIRIISQLPNFKGIICLTATPISESLVDTQAYLILAGYYRNPTDFKHQHVTRLDQYFKPITRDRANVIHNEWLTNYQLIIKRFKSIQVYVNTKRLLPKTIFKTKTFKFDKKTQKQYRQIRKDYLNGVYDSIAAANAAQRDFIAQHDTQRRKYLSDVINSKGRPSGPVLIFYQYNSERDSLREYLPKAHPDYKIFEINGSHKFNSGQRPPDKSLFLCQYIASGEALNANWSHTSVFYAPTYSWEKFKQARGRNVRAHQQGTTYQVRLIVLKTINQHYWYDLIDNKRAFTTDLMEHYLTIDE